MNNRIVQQNTESRSLSDKAYDLLGEMLLEQEAQALLASIAEGTANGGNADMDAFFARRDAKNLETITKHFHKQRIRSFFCETLPKAGRAAAIIVAALAVAGGVAIAASHTVRVQVMKLLTQAETEYTQLSLVEDTEASFDIPAEWEGDYYPSYVPKGLSLYAVYPWPGDNSIEYVNNDTGTIQISFSECDDSTITNIDMESATTKDITIHGDTGILSTKGDRIIIYWDNGRKYFILMTTDLDETTTIKVAESVMLVQ